MAVYSLVFTKDVKFNSENERKIYLNKFFCGYDYEIDSTTDMILEENLDGDFLLSLKKKIERLKRIVIKVLAKELNKIHEIDFSERLWERLIDVWISHILYNVFCKYYRVKYLVEKFSSGNDTLCVNVLSPDNYQIVVDLTEFTFETLWERYDFQLWSRVLVEVYADSRNWEMHEVVYDKETKGVRSGEQYNKGTKNFDLGILHHEENRVKRIKKLKEAGKYTELEQFVYRLSHDNYENHLKCKGYLYYPSFPSELFERIIFESKGEIMALPYDISKKSYKYEKIIAPNYKIRERLLKAVFVELTNITDDEKRIIKISLQELPLCYLEAFKSIRQQYMKYLNDNVRFILSQHGAYLNTGFLFYTIEMSELYKCNILGIQHGGDYQLLETPFLQDFIVTDKIYCWGQKNDNQFIESAPLKFDVYSAMEKNQERTNEQVLFLGSGYFRPYLFRGCVDSDIDMRFQMRFEFLETISDDVKKEILIREDCDFGWEMQEVTRKRFPYLKYDNKNNDFLTELAKSKICVCAYIGTPWLETLALNRPLIIFYEGYEFKNTEYSYRESEKQYLDLMKQAGILFDSPIEAAKLLNRIINDLDSWWNEPFRQELVKIVKKRYWNDFGAPDMWWKKEMLSLVGTK